MNFFQSGRDIESFFSSHIVSKNINQIPSNIWKTGGHTVLSEFKPNATAKIPQILDYFDIINYKAKLLCIFLLLLFGIFLTFKSGKLMKSFFGIFETVVQKEKIFLPDSKIFKSHFYIGIFLFFSLFLNLLHIDMIVDNEHVPIRNLYDLIDKRNDHIEPVWEMSSDYLFFDMQQSKKGTIYRKIYLKADKMNNYKDKKNYKFFKIQNMTASEKLAEGIIQEKYALINFDWMNILFKRFMCKKYKNIKGIRWISKPITKRHYAFPINKNTTKEIKEGVNIM